MTAADAADGAKYGPRGRRDGEFAGIAEECAAGPIGIAGDGAGHAPVGLHAMLGDFGEGGADGVAHVQQRLRDEFDDTVFAADHGVLEAFGEGLGDLVTEGRHEVNPI